jgi:transposase
MDDHTLDPKSGDIRRIEVITGAGRRRRWPTEVKARIVAESFSGDVPASEVARRPTAVDPRIASSYCYGSEFLHS